MTIPNTESIPNSFDYIVIGGGPGGSTVASILAQSNKSVLVLEGAKFPRFSVGEIVAPTSFWRIWDRLGLDTATLDKYFIRKYFGIFHAPDGLAFRFLQDVHPEDSRTHGWVYTFERAVYDKLLLDMARERGVVALEEAWVDDVLRDASGSVNGVRFTHQGQTHEVKSKLVIDASGRSHILAQKLGLALELTQLTSFASFAHWKGVRRDAEKAEGDVHIIFDDNKWYWYAPLKGEKTSLGVVANRNSPLWSEYQEDPEQFYDKHIRQAPFIGERLTNAQRVTGFQRPKRGSDATLLEDYHYSTRNLAGDGWVLVGDASGFVDPVLSAGLCIAQTSAAKLADVILRADSENDLSKAHLQAYEQWFVREYGEVWGLLQRLATDYFQPQFMNKLLHQASDDKHFGNLLTYGFIAYDKEALREFADVSASYFTRVEGPVHPAVAPVPA